MSTARLETFSDAVIAIIITITVLGVHVPSGANLHAIVPVIPVLLIYAWSFQTIGTYWNNHHYLMHATENATPAILWANLHLLFWLSLVPFTTEWLGEHIFMPWPTAAYGAVLLFSSVAYSFLEQTIIKHQGKSAELAIVLGNRVKEVISLGLYFFAVVSAFVIPPLSYVLVISVSVLWFIPGKRLL